MIRRLVPLAVLLALVLTAGGVAADDEFDRLFALDDPDHWKHDEATTWWEELRTEAKIVLLRRMLASDDKRTARLAAHAIGHPYLDSAELDRKMILLHGDLAASFGRGPGWALADDIAIGAADVVPLYRTAAASTELAVTPSTLNGLHRCARPSSAPELVALLETKNEEVFESLLFTILNLGDFDREDTQREAIARGALYGLRRLRAVRAWRPFPELAEIKVAIESPEGGGLPPAAVEIARATHPEEKNGFSTGDNELARSVAGPLNWIRRWLLDLTPGPKDVDYLHEVVQIATTRSGHHYHDGLLRWALRHLLRMPGPRGKAQVEAWAQEKGKRGLYAAAALAEAGRRVAFQRHVEDNDPLDEVHGRDASIDALLWALDPLAARVRLSTRMLLEGPHERHSPFHEGSLTWNGRLDLASYDDAAIRVVDLEAIATRLWGASEMDLIQRTRMLAWFHTAVHPMGLDPTRTAALVKLLIAMPSIDWEDIEFGRWERFFAVLEVRDRAGTGHVLTHWMTTQPTIRDRLLPLLARLGASGHEAALIKAWATWDPRDKVALGLVPGETVEAFLLAKRQGATAKGDPERLIDSWAALFALLRRAGQPEAVHALLGQAIDMTYEEDGAEASRCSDAWDLYTRGDPVGCLLGIAEWLPYGIYPLGAVDDERVRAWLRKRRAAREHGLYWEATAALAHHDASAAKDIRDMLGSGRTWLISDVENFAVKGTDRDRLTAMLTGDLDTNCCLSWAAGLHIWNLWPWFEGRFGMGGPGTVATRAYLASHGWKHSAIFGGLVPAPR